MGGAPRGVDEYVHPPPTLHRRNPANLEDGGSNGENGDPGKTGYGITAATSANKEALWREPRSDVLGYGQSVLCPGYPWLHEKA